MKNKLLIVFYFITLLIFSAWTWILTAPNLVLSTHNFYWQTQTYLWDFFYPNRIFVSTVYLILMIALFSIFFLIIRHSKITNLKTFLLTLFIFCLPLLLSYNALSYDVFNYLFNAKMVVTYQANPHHKTALDFPADPWVRFMHNTHTSAPYGYGWTAISLIPFYLFGSKFTLTWFSFRIFNLLPLMACLLLMLKFQKKINNRVNYHALSLFFFNPLVLIEVLTNFHNDLWMMFPALFALYLIYPTKGKKTSKLSFFISFICLIFSFTIKYASLALLPAWIFLLVLSNINQLLGLFLTNSKKLKKLSLFLEKNFFDLCAFLMFLPLLTPRSQLFHPWYLLWSLTFISFVKTKARICLLILSFSSLLRYIPYLWENGYTSSTLPLQQIITFTPLIIYLLILSFYQYNKHHAQKTINLVQK